jgi:4-amino-4-deoxy-L-arabinose transferase-like glycosyltransferase
VKKFNKHSIFLIVLLLVSFFIRVYKIDNLSLFGDEIDVGYQAFSLLQTGRDYKGNFLPTYIQSLSESRAPLLIYLTIPSIKIFGLNELGVRITPIIFGILSIFLLYKLVYFLSQSNALALLSASALSFSPWHFHYSRTAFEVTLLLSLILTGVYFAYKFLNSSKNKFLYLSIFSFCLSFYAYNTANIFVPLIILTIFITNLKTFVSKIKIKNFSISLIIFLLLTLPLLFQIFFGTAANRFNLISIFNNPTTINQIIDKRTSFSAASPKLESIFHNKATAWGGELAKNYLSSFSLPFIFIFGDQINYRHSVPEFGLIFLALMTFFLFGLFQLNFKDKLNQLMFFWLLFSPIASSLTISGSTHATRLFLMVVPLSYFVGLGLQKTIKLKTFFAKIFLFLSILFLTIQIIGYSHEYFIHYPKDSFEVWNYGYKQLFQSVPKTDKNIFISNAKYNSLLPFSFYQKRLFDNGFLTDTPQNNIDIDLSGFYSDPNTFFITDFNQTDHLYKINQIAKTGDTFLLFQGYDIPGDMNFSLKPLDGYKTITTVYNPNQTILGQVIQKL